MIRLNPDGTGTPGCFGEWKCDDGDPCTIDRCDREADGACENVERECPPGMHCIDGACCDLCDTTYCQGTCCSGVCMETGCCPGIECNGACCGNLDSCDEIPSCVNGQCVLSSLCPPQDDPCKVTWCEGSNLPCPTAECGWDPATAGTACADENPPNPCTKNECDLAGFCQHPPTNEGGACQENDNNPCTLGQCVGGTCTPVPGNQGGACQDDGEECTLDVCSNGSCTHPPLCESMLRVIDEDDDASRLGGPACCGTTCCPAGNYCCPDGVTCCPNGTECCMGVCCPGGADCGVSVTLKEIRFGNDHQMYEEAAPCEAANPDFCWGAGAALSGPDWRSVDNPDHPLCYARNTSMSILVSFQAQGHGGGTAFLWVTGPDGVIGSAGFTAPCGTQDFKITVPTSALPNVVKAYTPATLNWFVQPPASVALLPVGTTTHRVYVTLGTPSGGTGNEPTNRRLNWACYAAAQAATPIEAIDGVNGGGEGIHERLNHDPPDDGNSGTIVADWRLLAGSPFTGECHQQAHFFNLAIQLIGAGVGTEYLTYASTDSDPTNRELTTAAALGITDDLDGNGVIGDETLDLIFDFNPPGNPGDRNLNNFEGSVEFSWGNYAVWPSLNASTACCLLLELKGIGAKQYWVYRAPSGFISYVHYSTEIPFPSCPTTCSP